ncbi:MAG: flavodoxin family protein [Lawsonibacter sp.]|nr:flavodoxin family protein [Lawsonibacter sp.]
MKTLILNGSPRVMGDTASLIKKVTEKISGEYRIVDTYRCSISPCIDCRYCWENQGCAIKDEMQEIYDYIQDCDNILIASPIYFSELTGKLLDVGSRLQTYWCAKYFRKEEPVMKSKKGAVILVGGGNGNINKPYDTACILLHHMNCYDIHELVYSHNTNERPAVEDKAALSGIDSILDFFNNRA